MPTASIPFKETHYFSSLICDYLDEKAALKPFYNRFPKKENFKEQLEEKQQHFNAETRAVLVSALRAQYKNVAASVLTTQNITALADEKTFTITTGHQLNLFTGPLYFFYKIIATINLCQELKQTHPHYNFVPVYWMATEDHDFEEINFFNFQGKKVQWNKAASGAVGDLDLDGLDDVFSTLSSQLGPGHNAQALRELFKQAYLEHDTLTQATRHLVNSLFSSYGLVILDGNDPALKRLFVPYIKTDVLEQKAFLEVTQTNKKLEALSANYNIQVSPRAINLFYIKAGIRERIVEEEAGVFSVVGTQITWTKSQLLKEIEAFPERFSPNVILRPLYQEVILPNLCYIGGGGELAYWLQLKSSFEAQNVPFPMLLLRNSVLLVKAQQLEKLEKLQVTIADLFLKQPRLMTKITKEISEVNIDFSPQKAHLQQQFEALYKLAERTDKSFLGAVGAQERKQLKGLEHLEKRLLKAQKRKLSDVLERVKIVQNALFPNQSLQERQLNFSEFYLEYGDQLIQQLVLNLHPLHSEFIILKLD